MNADREALVDKSNALELNAKIAVMARHDEMVSFVNDLITKCGLNGTLYIYNSKYDENIISDTYPSLQIFHKEVPTSLKCTICVKYDNSEKDVFIYTSGLDYHDISLKYKSDSVPYVDMIKFMLAFNEALPKYQDLINSFGAYDADINAYLQAKIDITAYDEKVYNAKLDAINNKLTSHMRISTMSNMTSDTIFHVTKKRVYFSKWSNGHRKSFDRSHVVHKIANNEWKICDT